MVEQSVFLPAPSRHEGSGSQSVEADVGYGEIIDMSFVESARATL